MLAVVCLLLAILGLAAAGLGLVVGTLFWRETRRNTRLRTDASPRGHARRVVVSAFAPPAVSLAYVTTVTDTAAVLVWRTAARRSTSVRLTGESGESTTIAPRSPPQCCHRVRLDGLQPESRYSAVVGDESDADVTRLTFRTGQSIGRVVFRFAALTDTHFKRDAWTWPDGRLYGRGREVHERMLNQMLAHDPAFILHKGDCSEPPGARRLARYADAVRRCPVPIHYIPGNHDYFRHPDFSTDWKRLTACETTYGSFTHRGLHVVLLDTCWTREQERGFLGATQLRWLRDELRAHADLPTLVVTHHPVYGDPEENRVCHDAAAFRRVLAGHGQVCAVLSGHVHRNVVRWNDQLPGVPNVETCSAIQFPLGYVLYEVGASGLRQSFHVINDFALSVESWGHSWLRSVTNPSDPMGSLAHRNFVLPWPEPAGAPH